ncbi:MAG: FlgO family outer membrane protein [Thermodesulfobacteriota bacterium]
MRKYAIPLVISFLAVAVAAFAQASHKTYRIAILEFDPVTDEAAKDNLGRVGAEFLITAAVNSGSFAVVERAAIKKVLDEMQFGQGNGAPATAAQAIGSMVGAQGVLTGSVAKTGNSVRLDARLIDVASGNIVAARSAYAKSDLRSIATASELLVSQLEGDLTRLTPPAPKPEPQAEAKAEGTPAVADKPASDGKASESLGDQGGGPAKEAQPGAL